MPTQREQQEADNFIKFDDAYNAYEQNKSANVNIEKYFNKIFFNPKNSDKHQEYAEDLEKWAKQQLEGETSLTNRRAKLFAILDLSERTLDRIANPEHAKLINSAYQKFAPLDAKMPSVPAAGKRQPVKSSGFLGETMKNIKHAIERLKSYLLKKMNPDNRPSLIETLENAQFKIKEEKTKGVGLGVKAWFTMRKIDRILKERAKTQETPMAKPSSISYGTEKPEKQSGEVMTMQVIATEKLHHKLVNEMRNRLEEQKSQSPTSLAPSMVKKSVTKERIGKPNAKGASR